MAIGRKRALEKLESLFPQVQKHLIKITREPEARDLSHWKNEAKSWLDQMEAVLRHVGKKTSIEWSAKIRFCRQAISEE